MTPAARLSAAIEVLTDIDARHQPAAEALADWGKAHRFAGSGDRAAIGNLVFDALRKRASLAWRMGSDTPRSLVLGLIAFHWGSPEMLAGLATGERHAPHPLTAEEARAIAEARSIGEAPLQVQGDYPEWLDDHLARVFGEARGAEGAAMADRAPIDLRVNTLKADRTRVLKAFERFGAVPGPLCPTALRIPAPRGPARAPNVEVEPEFLKGFVELQDEASQIAALLAGARPGEQVADLCAGGGGKTLALAAAMDNRGQLYAWDADRHRLAPIYARLERAGARNVQVKRGGDPGELDALAGRMDRVVLDVPCTGSGAWRRRPDAKWRLKERAIGERMGEQDRILRQGAAALRPGGELVYITCSLLAEENEDRVAAFLTSEAGRGFEPIDLTPRWRSLFAAEPPALPPGVRGGSGLRLSPRATGTDGFFICALRKVT